MDATSLFKLILFIIFLYTRSIRGGTCNVNFNECDFISHGSKGEPGNSTEGQKGDIGSIGPVGRTGTKGLDGAKGDCGDTGLKGEPGAPGIKGDKGETEEGREGPPGMPGMPGVCRSINPTSLDSYFGANPMGTVTNPFQKACKFSTADAKTSKNLTFYPPSPFQANCDMENKTTCIAPSEKTLREIEINALHYKNKTTAFWSSSLGFGFKDLYGLSLSQMQWLHDQSSYIKMTLRYHCKNSVVFPKYDVKRALNLLSWSDKVIGPYPTKKTPFYYSVLENEDGCKDSEANKDQWKSTDILLISEVMSRLPILDFYIQDVRGEEQSFYVELVELCFG